MALATPPTSAMAEHIHPAPTSFVSRYIFTLDHKIIGIQYLITGTIFFIISGLLAELIRIQLMHSDGRFIGPEAFNQLYSVHGSSMVWLVIIPLATGGFGNFVMPLMIGARDVAFPWLNMASFWMFPPAGLILFSSFLVGAPDAGWTEYPPVSLQGPPGTSMWCAAIFLIGISSTLTGMNFLATMLKMRAPGMTFTRMPLFVWAQLATAVLNMVATAALSADLAALFIERTFGVPFFNPDHGGSPILWQHMFWFYSHPAVYIMILPAFGIISEILPTFARKPIFGYKMIAFSSIAIAGLGFMVWAHHMFTSGMVPWLQLPFMLLTMLIAIPTGIKIFSWVATLWGGSIRFSTAMLFAIGFVCTFTLGGITGIFLAAVPVDYQAHGTYFIVAHIHYVLFGGSVFGLLAGVYYWFPKMTGRMLNETWGKIHFWLAFIAFNVTFLPMHWLGLLGMPRRVPVYDPQFTDWNRVASIGSFFLVLGMLIFFINVIWSIKHGKRVGPNPWNARTLDWMTSSPPPYYNFEKIPAVLHNPYDFSAPLPYIGLANPEKVVPGYSAPMPSHAGSH